MTSGTGAPGVRRARAADRTALAGLWGDLLAHHARLDAAFALDGDVRSVSARAIEAVSHDPGAAAWIAESAAAPTGFCVARVEKAAAPLVECSRGEITELWVRSDARRQGIGRALAEVALAWVGDQGVARVEVRVAARNAEGGAFWRALGFGAFVDVLDRRL